MAYKVLGSLLFVIQGYEASPGILSSLFLSYMGPAFVGALVLLFISWRIARMFYKTRSYSLWLSLVVGIIIIFWFLLLFTLLPAVLAFVPIPSGMGFAISLLLGIALNFVHVSVLVCILLATLVSVFRWNKGKGGKGLWAPIIATVLATGMLVAFSGALKYPAQALGADMLCYGVLSKTERSLCLASSFVPSEDAAFDIIQIPFSYPHAFAMVGGRFVFIAQEKEDDGMRTKSDAVYADGVRLPGTGSIFGFQDVGDGRIAYVVSAYESGDMTGSTLFLEDEEIASGDRVALIPGTGLTYLFSDAEATYVTKEGKIVAEGEEAQEYFAARRAEWLAVQNQPSDSITLKRDDEKREMTYTIGDMTIVHAQDGLYANGKPLMRGFSTWPPTVVEGKVVLGAFGMGTDMKLETYIIAEKGLLSEEVRARLEAL
jgi:hypothetical protein